MASMLAVAPMITGFPHAWSTEKAHPVKAQARQVGFVATSVGAMRTARNATGSVPSKPGAADPVTTARAVTVTSVQDVAGAVTVVGVTWNKGAAAARSLFQIRTLTGATWSQWESLENADGGPDGTEAAATKAATTAGTDPYVVTGASKYEVRSLTTDASVPTGATVQAVDPGTSSADDLQAAPGAAAAASAQPTIYTRAQWGADEGLRRAAPAYGNIQVGFVHHTDSANSYTASEVPAMLRGIYAYHVQSQGWNDIGYNFLVDRFGRIWEGRFGGMDKAVVGAQTMNYNSVSMGVSAIGNYDIAGVPQAMTDAFKRVFAWKFSLTGIPATGTVVAAGKSFQRVSGHRDGFATACPGRYLYPKLAEIRSGAAAIIAASPPVVIKPVITRSLIVRDVDRNGAGDALSYRPGTNGTSIAGPVSVLASVSRVPVRSGVVIGGGWNSVRNASLSPDLNGDGKADIVAQHPTSNQLRIYLGNGKGGFAGILNRGSGWNAMTRVFAAGDRNADGRSDILATTATGDLVYYPVTGAAAVQSGRRIGAGWNVFRTITNAGDLNGDTRPDLLATLTSTGVQLMYAGRSDGGVTAGVRWGAGWGTFSSVTGGSDLDGDRYPDVYARRGDAMATYSADSRGRLSRYIHWGSGWANFTQLSTGADWSGDGVADLLAVNPAANGGSLNLYTGTGQRDFRIRAAAFPTVAGADLLRLVGDVNGDGYTDAVARVRTNNTLVILLGKAGSQFYGPRKIGSGWNAFSLVEAAGDYDGDGVPDLLARDASGVLFVYPLQKNLIFKSRLTVGAGFGAMRSVLGAGAYDQDVYGDVIGLRASDHALILFRGTGSRALLSGSVLATAQNDLVQILGFGDYNGDRKADLMARSSAGSLWLYPGNGSGGIANRQPVRGGEGAGHVLG
jgi:hypothetical protein